MNTSCKREKKKAVDERGCMPARGKERTGGIHSPKHWKACYGIGNLTGDPRGVGEDYPMALSPQDLGAWRNSARTEACSHCIAHTPIPPAQRRQEPFSSPTCPVFSVQAKRQTPQFCTLLKRHFQMLLRKRISTNKPMRIMDATDRTRTHGKQFKVTAKENTFQSFNHCQVRQHTGRKARTEGRSRF